MVTRRVLDEKFSALGGTDGFLKAIKAGPEWLAEFGCGHGRPSRLETLHGQGRTLYRQYIQPHARPRMEYPSMPNDCPAYLPFLCLLCLAWTEGEEDLHDTAFYARLENLYPRNGLTPNLLPSWDDLWDKLQKWTERLEGRSGWFVVERLGQMVHVGIPRSQVLLTPERIDRLPELFRELPIPYSAPKEQLRSAILDRHWLAEYVLGLPLVEQIEKSTDLGSSALALVQECFQNWDGRPATEQPTSTPATRRAAQLVVVLEPTETNDALIPCFGISEPDDYSGLTIGDRTLEVVIVNDEFTLVRSREPNAMWIADYGERLQISWTINATLTDDVTGTRPIALRVKQRDVRALAWYPGSPHRLVETDKVPASGDAYILWRETLANQWHAWVTKLPAANQAQDINLSGIPTGWQLTYIPHFYSLSEHIRNSTPGRPVQSTCPRVLRLLGGSTVSAGSVRRVYLPYDPPQVVLEAEASVNVDAVGAEIQEVAADTNGASRLPGTFSKIFDLYIAADANSVRVTAIRNGAVVDTLDFGVWHDTNAAPRATTAEFWLDDLGSTASTGVQGTFVANAANVVWDYKNGPSEKGAHFDKEILQQPAFLFLESISLGGKPVTYSEFKRRACSITNIEPIFLSRQTAWLADLGVIEIENDARGRWSYVHPCGLQLYCLPWLCDGRYQAVITGCAPRQTYSNVIEQALSAGCKVRVVANEHTAVPPRISLLHEKLHDLGKIASAVNAKWNKSPAGLVLAKWSANFDAWLSRDTPGWLEGTGPEPEGEYKPELFRTVAGERHCGPYRLRWLQDTETKKHRWFTVIHNDWTTGTHYTFVRDPAWAKWKVLNSVFERDDTPVPYIELDGGLILPFELRLPYLLSRALTVCSGMPPGLLFNNRFFVDTDLGFVPGLNPQPYGGQCWHYRLVPAAIAKLALSKLFAVPLSPPNIQSRHG
jgi:hypothetical protein